ncbi:uncharacterized protein F4812DRAFT_468037 [Daldinia caldariorum]|uniref:uncharacterized protein n=1 Tax=Daldinia caldariorum TaxID=326644 RepID=UPI00200790DD|nr:uncharacterized protein F4812DRAFT_468037 [Daldinia caldariorum]KAI1464397.1 hypothetical protein F4812DRAFT_468037 [Daldinia caldariorum]
MESSSADSADLATALATATQTQTPAQAAGNVEGHHDADGFSTSTMVLTALCVIPVVAIAAATHHARSRNATDHGRFMTGLRIFAFTFGFIVIAIFALPIFFLHYVDKPAGDVEGATDTFCDVSDLDIDAGSDNDDDDELALRPGEVGAPTDDFVAGQCTPEEGYTPDRSAMNQLVKEKLAEMKRSQEK